VSFRLLTHVEDAVRWVMEVPLTPLGKTHQFWAVIPATAIASRATCGPARAHAINPMLEDFGLEPERFRLEGALGF